jgi:hypothetical protein
LSSRPPPPDRLAFRLCNDGILRRFVPDPNSLLPLPGCHGGECSTHVPYFWLFAGGIVRFLLQISDIWAIMPA